jgi:hypothetical protein
MTIRWVDSCSEVLDHAPDLFSRISAHKLLVLKFPYLLRTSHVSYAPRVGEAVKLAESVFDVSCYNFWCQCILRRRKTSHENVRFEQMSFCSQPLSWSSGTNIYRIAIYKDLFCNATFSPQGHSAQKRIVRSRTTAIWFIFLLTFWPYIALAKW